MRARLLLGGLAVVLTAGLLALMAGESRDVATTVSVPAGEDSPGAAAAAIPRSSAALESRGQRRPEEAAPTPPVQAPEELLTPAERWAIKYKDCDVAALTKARDVLALEMSRLESKLIRSRLDAGQYDGYPLDDGRNVPNLNLQRDRCLANRERYFEQTAFRPDGATEYQFLVIPRQEYPDFYTVVDERNFLDEKLIALQAWQPLQGAPGGSPVAW